MPHLTYLSIYSNVFFNVQDQVLFFSANPMWSNYTITLEHLTGYAKNVFLSMPWAWKWHVVARSEDFTRWSCIWRVLYHLGKILLTGSERLPGGLVGRWRLQNSWVWCFSGGFKYRLPAQLPIVSEIEHFLGRHAPKVDRIEPRSRLRLPEPISGQKCEKIEKNMKNH